MTERAKLTAIAAAITAIAALCWWLAFAGGTPAPAEPVEPAIEPAATPEPVPAPAPQPPAQEPPADEAPAPATAPAPTFVLPDTRGFTAALEERFATDARDPDANAAATALRERIGAKDLPPGLLRTIECRRTTCKLELRWTLANDAAYQKLTATLMGDNAKLFATRAFPPPDKAGAMPVDGYWVRR